MKRQGGKIKCNVKRLYVLFYSTVWYSGKGKAMEIVKKKKKKISQLADVSREEVMTRQKIDNF